MKYVAGLMALALVLTSCSSDGERKSSSDQKKMSAGDQKKTSAGDQKKTSAGDQKSPAASMDDSRAVSTVATVQAIDLDKRKITLRDQRGESMTFKVDDRVKNLSQVKVGDHVAVGYFECLSVEVVKPAKAVNGKAAGVNGEMPAGGAARSVTVTATIDKIDPSAPSITLRDPDGNLITVRVRHPERLEKVKVGDQLQITYSEAVAISVRPAPAQVR